MVIHTLCISPRWAGRGKAREFVAFCEEEARRKGKKVMRLDTYEGNLPANTMYPCLLYTSDVYKRQGLYLCGRDGVLLPGLYPGDPELLRQKAVNGSCAHLS